MLPFINPLDEFDAQSVSYTGTAGSTTGWPAGPEGVGVWSDQDCYVVVGESVTATTAGMPLPAGVAVAIKVPGGTGALWRVSAIQISTGGTLYCKPINAR